MGLTEKEKLVVKEIGLCTGNESMLNDENIFWKLIIYLKIVHLSIPIDCEYIQLLFLGNSETGHWICMYYSNNIIYIYDSLNVKC